MSCKAEGYLASLSASQGSGSVVYSSYTLSADEKSTRIDRVLEELMAKVMRLNDFENIKEVAETQSIALMQKKLQSILSSPEFEAKLNSLKELTEIREPSDEEIKAWSLPPHVINMQIKRDGSSLPFSLFVHFTDGKFIHSNTHLNMLEILEKFKKAKGKTVDHLCEKSLAKLRKDVKLMKRRIKLEEVPAREKAALVKIFNETWKGKFTANYTEDRTRGEIEVSDLLGIYGEKWMFTLMPKFVWRDKEYKISMRALFENPLEQISASRSRFWNDRKVLAIGAAALLAVIVTAVAAIPK